MTDDPKDEHAWVDPPPPPEEDWPEDLPPLETAPGYKPPEGVPPEVIHQRRLRKARARAQATARALPPEAMAPRRPTHPGRIVVNGEISHWRSTGGGHRVAGMRWARVLTSDAKPYDPEVTVGESWVTMDRGWVQEHSLLLITNVEGRFTQAVPTPEEREEAAMRVVEVGVTGEAGGSATPLTEPVALTEPAAFAVVRPGESLLLEPHNVGRLNLRCRRGQARVELILFPG